MPAQGAVPIEAYELYLQGRYHWNRRPGPSVWEGLRCFEKAVEREPRFAAAWAGIADVYATLGSWESGVLPPEESLAKATSCALRALELDPDLADAHSTLAYTALHHQLAPERAEQGFRHALELNPSYAAAHHWYSHCLVAVGRFAESLAESRVAVALDPMNLVLNVHLSWHHHMAREPERALEQAERALKLDARFHGGHYFVGWAAEGVGDQARAVEAMREAMRCSGDDSVMLAGLARALASAGDRREALAAAAELEKRRQGRAMFAYELALVHLALGDRDRALELLERARLDRSGWLAYLGVDPRLDPVRTNPRFAAITTSHA